MNSLELEGVDTEKRACLEIEAEGLHLGTSGRKGRTRPGDERKSRKVQ